MDYPRHPDYKSPTPKPKRSTRETVLLKIAFSLSLILGLRFLALTILSIVSHPDIRTVAMYGFLAALSAWATISLSRKLLNG